MRSLSRASFLAALLALAVAFSPGGAVHGQGAKKGKGNSKTYTFKSFDGVELSGTLYANIGGKRDAVVLLLHNFDLKKGGSSTQDGWTDLAAELQKDGYAVFAFDFRGFGNSKNVDKDRFWKYTHNGPGNIKRRGGAKLPESIEHGLFSTSYLPYLVNDIAAAKAFLDGLNDNKEVNTNNLLLIGAGEGATLGAMWLAHEARRRKDTAAVIGPPGMLGEPEVRDVAGAVWLSISPRIGSRQIGLNLQRWLIEVGQKHKVPMCFFHGAKDSPGDTLAKSLVKAIKPDKSKAAAELKSTVAKAVPDTRFVGSQLLDRDLETGKLIKQYLDHVMENRSARKWAERKVAMSRFFYVIPGTRSTTLNKPANEEVPSVQVGQFLR